MKKMLSLLILTILLSGCTNCLSKAFTFIESHTRQSYSEILNYLNNYKGEWYLSYSTVLKTSEGHFLRSDEDKDNWTQIFVYSEICEGFNDLLSKISTSWDFVKLKFECKNGTIFNTDDTSYNFEFIHEDELGNTIYHVIGKYNKLIVCGEYCHQIYYYKYMGKLDHQEREYWIKKINRMNISPLPFDGKLVNSTFPSKF